MRGLTLSPFRKRGFATAIGFVVLTVFGSFVFTAFAGTGLVSFGERIVEAEFDQALNLVPRSSEVKVRGITVGRVKSLRLDGDRVVVSFTVEPDIDLRADATARLRSRSLLAEKYVDLVPGKASEPLRGRISNTSVGTDITALTSGSPEANPDLLGTAQEQLSATMDIVAEQAQLQSPTAEQAIAQAADLTAKLADDSGPLFATIDDIGSLVDSLNSAADRLAPMFDTADMALRRVEALRAKAAKDFARADTSLKVLLAVYENNAPALNQVLDQFEVMADDGLEAFAMIQQGASLPVTMWGWGDVFARDPRAEGPNPWPKWPQFELPKETKAPWK